MGYRMGQNKIISMVCYADDAAIFEKTDSRPSEVPKKTDQQSICHVGLLKADNMGERIHAKG